MRAPITQLWRDLARMRPFPTCDEALPAQATRTLAWYDPCPSGTSELERGVLALQRGAPETDPPAKGIGPGDELTPDSANGVSHSKKVCVGQEVGRVAVWFGTEAEGYSATVNVYDRVAFLDPASSPNAIDVYIDGALYRRVRW
jgi:hypothetical protein